MGVPLVMEPNFKDYSCQVTCQIVIQLHRTFDFIKSFYICCWPFGHVWQFKFGVLPPPPEDDTALKEPCLEACPTANRRKHVNSMMMGGSKCPKA